MPIVHCVVYEHAVNAVSSPVWFVQPVLYSIVMKTLLILCRFMQDFFSNGTPGDLKDEDERTCVEKQK